MLIQNREDRFELVRVPASESGENFDDRCVRIAVSCRLFSARVEQLYVVGREWVDFASALQELERTRRGEAIVAGIDPDVFRVRVYSWDSSGHLALEGHIGKYHGCDHGIALQQFRFAMDMPADQLGALVASAESIARPG